jgi:hypothetical protein
VFRVHVLVGSTPTTPTMGAEPAGDGISLTRRTMQGSIPWAPTMHTYPNWQRVRFKPETLQVRILSCALPP